MPKLVPDQKERGLFVNPESGIYYVKKSIAGKGRIYTTLRTRDRKIAIRQMDLELSSFLSREMSGEKRINEIFFELLELYLLTRSKASYENFKIICKLHVLPYFNDYKIKDVAKGIPSYIAYQKKRNPKRKLYHDVKHITRLLNYSVERGYIDGFPKYKLDRSERNPKPGKEYSNDEIKKILCALNERHKLQALLMLYTGMRPGEARTLKWEYIDFKNKLVTLPAEVVKTRYGRTYPIEGTILEKLALRKLNSKGSYVFPSKLDANTAEIRSTKQWQRAEAKVKFKVRPHWFRHTHATRALRAGMPIALISRNLGMSTAILERVYLHPSEEDQKQMAGIVAQTLPDFSHDLGNSGKSKTN